MGLDDLRHEIAEADHEIVDLIARRIDLAIEVNREKVKRDRPVHDEEQVEQVLERVTDLATERGVDSHIVKEIFETIIEQCEEKQYELRGERSVL